MSDWLLYFIVSAALVLAIAGVAIAVLPTSINPVKKWQEERYAQREQESEDSQQQEE